MLRTALTRPQRLLVTPSSSQYQYSRKHHVVLSKARTSIVSGSLHWSFWKKYPPSSTQRRSYVFLPSSLEEFGRSLEQLWRTDRKERRIILVKLLKDQTSNAKDYALSKATTKRTALRQGRQRAFLAAEQGWAGARANIQKYRHKGVESFQRYKQKYYDQKNRIYKKHVITLEEYSQEHWFDENGYPQTARDERTGRFVNPWNSESTNGHHSVWEFLKWRFQRLFAPQELESSSPRQNEEPSASQPAAVSTTRLPPLHNPNVVRLTWIGHSTAFVEMSGFTILTDPHFSHRASPSQQFGIARHVDPAVTVHELPDVDVCCISHDHYDHLDYESVCALSQKVQHWVVPLGIREWLQVECNISPNQISELQWWESVRFQTSNRDKDGLRVVTEECSSTGAHAEMTITCAPAQHWCSRTPWDRNVRLWCSFAVESASPASTSTRRRPLKFYFGGDTGLPPTFPLHRQIGDRLGPFDLAALPIGAYAPGWFMADSHVNPREAVQIHRDVRAKKSVAIHWGTFRLADEANDEPPLLLRQAIDDVDDEPIDFVVLRQGESVESNTDLEEYNNVVVQQQDESDGLEDETFVTAQQNDEMQQGMETQEEEESSDDDEKQRVGYG